MAVIQNKPFNLFGEYVGLGLQLEYFQINDKACLYPIPLSKILLDFSELIGLTSLS